MGDGDGEIKTWLGIGSEKLARLGRVLVAAQSDVEGALDVADGTLDVENDAVGVSTRDGEAVGIGELDDGGVIHGSRAELPGKFLRGEELVEIGAGRVVKVRKEPAEGGLISQRQGYREMELPGRVELSGRFQRGDRRRYVSPQLLQSGGLATGEAKKPEHGENRRAGG